MAIFNESWQVIIVGAGPVGLIAANLLGQYQIKTLLIEKEDLPYSYPRALGIDDEALRSVQLAGFTQEEIQSQRAEVKVEYFSLTGYRSFEPDPEMKRFGYPILSSFLQPKLEIALREHLNQYPHVTFIKNSQFISYKKNTNNIAVEIEIDKKRETVHCIYLLGCDGGKSDIRVQADIHMPGVTLREALVVDLNDSEAIRKNMQEYQKATDRQRPLASLNAPGGLRRFEILTETEEYTLGDLDEPIVRGILEPILKNTDTEIVRRRIYTLHFRIADKFNDGKVFLLGDAAHLVPPYGGQGMCSGIKDAVNICWKLAYVLQGKMNENIINTYEEERRQHMLKIMEFIKRISQNLAREPDNGQSNASIESNYYRKIKPLPKYENGIVIPSDFAGDLLPQPEVKDSNGHSGLLDDFLDKGFAIIGINSAPHSVLSEESRQFWDSLDTRYVYLSTVSGSKEIRGSITPPLFFSGESDVFRDQNIMIIRPDRFILCTCDTTELNKMTQKIQSILS
ncbi:FAD-dependent monooxygenase [uncultured Legionella sp.]|uniref:FAD-dependent monooxygenase n=1 Tax=uncultured Legionella sp. TaxID=210934 RepID=UPI002612A22D|nr:FAD-dependent monooxygenase [uncultured Legionella sp.]